MTPAEFDTWLLAHDRRSLVMGILNVTPDSFSDGGRFATVDAALEQAEAMVRDGADLIDIGGESTRPGSQRVPAEEQARRVVPVIEAIRRRGLDLVLSVDTTLAPVAAAALDAGADMVNDIAAGCEDAELLPVVARRQVPVVLMHMRGTPETMQRKPAYDDVTAEVTNFLRERGRAAVSAGVEPGRVIYDPGIGFGKTLEHNLTLLRRLPEVGAALGGPLLLGTSRKKFIGTLTGEDEPSRRLFGTAATVAWCVANGAAIVRVHDVGPMAQVVRMTRAIVAGTA